MQRILFFSLFAAFLVLSLNSNALAAEKNDEVCLQKIRDQLGLKNEQAALTVARNCDAYTYETALMGMVNNGQTQYMTEAELQKVGKFNNATLNHNIEYARQKMEYERKHQAYLAEVERVNKYNEGVKQENARLDRKMKEDIARNNSSSNRSSQYTTSSGWSNPSATQQRYNQTIQQAEVTRQRTQTENNWNDKMMRMQRGW